MTVTEILPSYIYIYIFIYILQLVTVQCYDSLWDMQYTGVVLYSRMTKKFYVFNSQYR